MTDKLVAELRAEIERQRETRGDIMDYGQPDPLLVRCLEALTRAADALEPSGDVVERVARSFAEAFWGRDWFDAMPPSYRETLLNASRTALGASHAE